MVEGESWEVRGKGRQGRKKMIECLKSVFGLREYEVLTEERFWSVYLKKGRRDFSRTRLLNVNLGEVDLRQISLQQADLRHCIFPSQLNKIDLKKVNLSGVDFSDRDLSGVVLTGANLINCNLVGANLSQANLSRAKLIDTNLERAILSDSRQVKGSKFISRGFIRYATL
jgi:uncharacterized protein YjbI with pentapeptide repeats